MDSGGIKMESKKTEVKSGQLMHISTILYIF